MPSGITRALVAAAVAVCCVGAVQVSAAEVDASWRVQQSPYQAGRAYPKEAPHGNAAIVRTVIDAVGLIRGLGPRETTNTVNRLRWNGDGTLYEAGRPVKVDYRYTMSLLQEAAREDIQVASADGSGRRQIGVVHGQIAWSESVPGVATGLVPDQAQKLRLKLWRTPFGIAKALAVTMPESVQVKDSGTGPVQLDFKIAGVATHVLLDSDYRPWRVSQQIGKDRIEDQYTDYKDFTEYGLMFPGHTVETVNGKSRLDVETRSADAGTYMVFEPPVASSFTKHRASKRNAP
jgi:hypothetical protein